MSLNQFLVKGHKITNYLRFSITAVFLKRAFPVPMWRCSRILMFNQRLLRDITNCNNIVPGNDFSLQYTNLTNIHPYMENIWSIIVQKLPEFKQILNLLFE